MVKNLPANAGVTGSIPGMGNFHMPRSEKVTCRKARSPQVAGGNKLIFFFLSLSMKPVLPKANVFFLFSNFGLEMAQQTSIHVNYFSEGVGGRGTTCLVKSYLP